MEDPTNPNATDDSYTRFPNQGKSAADEVKTSTASVQDAVKDGASQAKDQAASLLEQATGKASAAASDQKDVLANTLDDVAQSVHKSAEQFAGQQDWIAGAIERGSTELSSLASSLRENDLGSLVDVVKSFAKRQPAVFVGVCLAGGFALARLGKVVAADVSRDDLPTMPEMNHGNN